MGSLAAYAKPATVLRPGEVDRWGDPVDGPAGQDVRVEIRGCVFVPGNSTEAGQWSNSVTTEATLLAPYGADLRASDRVTYPGVPGVWSVEGAPASWRSPLTGRRFGVSAALRRVEG